MFRTNINEFSNSEAVIQFDNDCNEQSSSQGQRNKIEVVGAEEVVVTNEDEDTEEDFTSCGSDEIHSVNMDNIGNIEPSIRRSGRERRQPDRLNLLANSLDEKFALSAEGYVENDPTSIQ